MLQAEHAEVGASIQVLLLIDPNVPQEARDVEADIKSDDVDVRQVGDPAKVAPEVQAHRSTSLASLDADMPRAADVVREVVDAHRPRIAVSGVDGEIEKSQVLPVVPPRAGKRPEHRLRALWVAVAGRVILEPHR